MRILITDTVAHYGGAQRIIARLLPALWGRGWPVAAAVVNADLAAALHGAGVPVTRLPPPEWPQRSPWQGRALREVLAEALRAARPDVIHAHSYASLWALSGISHCPPVVWTAHSVRPLLMPREPLSPRPPQAVIAVARAVAASWGLGKNAGRYEVIHHGIPELEARRDQARPEHRESAPLRLLTLARPSRRKGVMTGIAAARLLRLHGVAMVWEWAGGDPLLAAQWQAETPHIQFRPHTAGPQTLLATCDAFVLPSVRGEGVPQAILEAMAHGRAVVASRLAGIPEVVEHGRTGLLVAPSDARDLAVAIARLGDTALRATLGAASAAEITAHWRFEDTVAAHAALYAEVAAAGRGYTP